jgi:hypothetical protein
MLARGRRWARLAHHRAGSRTHRLCLTVFPLLRRYTPTKSVREY